MNDESSAFILGVKVFREPNKEYDWKLNIINNGVPIEVVIMLLKSLAKNYEEGYFNNFNNKL